MAGSTCVDLCKSDIQSSLVNRTTRFCFRTEWKHLGMPAGIHLLFKTPTSSITSVLIIMTWSLFSNVKCGKQLLTRGLEVKMSVSFGNCWMDFVNSSREMTRVNKTLEDREVVWCGVVWCVMVHNFTFSALIRVYIHWFGQVRPTPLDSWLIYGVICRLKYCVYCPV